MKTNFIKAFILSAILTGSFAEAKAQTGFGSILESMAGGNTGQDIISGLTSIFSNNKVATADKLVGTWVYEEPAIVFESSNLLQKAGGTIVSSRIEKKLQTVLAKYGIKKGNMKMTFTKNGNFTQTIGKRTVHGTYKINGKNVELKYAGGFSQLLGTTQLEGNSLLIVMDATRLLKFAGVVSKFSTNTMIKTAASLFSSVDGMECGVRLKKVTIQR